MEPSANPTIPTKKPTKNGGNGKSGNESTPTSSRDPRTCRFCGKPLEPLGWMEVDGIRRPYGEKPCSCPEGAAWWAEIRESKRRLWQEMEDKAREERIRELFQSSQFPERWKTRTFERFEVNEQNRPAFEKAVNFAETFRRGQGTGLLFTGPVGTGKTHLAAAITMALLEKEYRVVFGTVASLLSRIRRTYHDSGSREQEWEVMKTYTTCDLLVIDDLGKERVTEWVEQTMYEIVNARYEENRAMIITTNMNLTDIRDRYGEHGKAMISRIVEMCKGIRMGGEDWRIKDLL